MSSPQPTTVTNRVLPDTSTKEDQPPEELHDASTSIVDTAAPPEETAEASTLTSLGADIRDQTDLERTIGRQANTLLLKQATERDQKRLEKTEKDRDRLLGQIRKVEEKLLGFGNHATKSKWRAEAEELKEKVGELDSEVDGIRKRMEEREAENEAVEGHEEGGGGGDGGEEAEKAKANRRLPGESQREFLIRTGKITPFSKLGRGGSSLLKTSSSLGDVLMDAEEEEEGEVVEEGEVEDEQEVKEVAALSHRNLLKPGFDQDGSASASAATSVMGDTDGDAELARKLQDEEFANERPAKRRRLQSRRQAREVSGDASTPAEDEDSYVPVGEDDIDAGMDDFVGDDDDSEGEVKLATTPGIKRKGRAKAKVSRRAQDVDEEQEDLAGIDDGNESVYQARVQSWVERRSAARRKAHDHRTDNDAPDGEVEEDEDGMEEWRMPHPNRTDTSFEGGFRIPGDIYPSLFDYQKTGVQWLWELYSQQVGGIIGDEMGLGKTIQVISFLAGLHYSGKLDKPIVVVCPATVMKQWVNEFHRWWPPLRVSILHTSGSGMLDVGREARIEDEIEEDYSRSSKTLPKSHKAAKRIMDKVLKDGHVLVTTYSGLQTYAELLIPIDWGYAVLDEGHKIRNPNTAITIYTKNLRTHNRLILSGTPMQNNLTELWSLFDFVFPMRLGTLVNFRNQFETPIKMGGYANASNLQVETAMKCAETLKDAISPYLLQRFKIDVASDLPKKSERVLFCRLTKLQRDAYEWFLESEDMKSIMAGKRQALYGVDILRKICNHPDLVEHKTLSKKQGYMYGDGKKSGKMQVVKALLEIWKRNGHKTLLFAQHRIMLDILESFIRSLPDGFKYRRMDGNTSIKDRQNLVDEFNSSPDLHVFLLTTKVGGLGVNLTGADRVIIYDPDWNPSTDVQARERAWRLGQKREVEIYRLMTAGTIEEKIYHRQIFKQFLTNKILRDPKQRQSFQLRDLHDLFTLGDVAGEGQTETSSIFQGSEVRLSGAASGRGKGKERAKLREEESLPTPPDDDAAPRDRDDEKAVGGIVGISRQENYRGESPDADGHNSSYKGRNPTHDPGPNTKDSRMLSTIFSRSGVHSALEHDAIINGPFTSNSEIRADPEIIAREARRVAAEAAKELQRAEEVARSVPAGVPTWTGVVGTAGRPEEDGSRGSAMSRGRGGMRGGRGGGPSSVAVLANLRDRQIGTNEGGPSSRSNTPTGSSTTASRFNRNGEQQLKGKDFLVAIRDFLVAQGGKAYTQMLIDHFNRHCKTEQRTAEFKEMLKTIAVLEKGGRGRGKWCLREEYMPKSGE